MDASADSAQSIDASIALATVLLFQIPYCLLHLHAADPSRFRMLSGLGGVFGACGITFLVLFEVFRREDDSHQYAYAMLSSCKGVTVLSIWVFEVVEILYQPRCAWLKRSVPLFPFSNSGSLLFWTGLITQIGFVGIGVWQLVNYRRELIWATPIVSHLNIATMANYAYAIGKNDRSFLLLCWMCVANVGFLASGLFLGLSIAGKSPQAAAQCIVCMALLSVQATRDRRERSKRLQASLQEESDEGIILEKDLEHAKPDKENIGPRTRSLCRRSGSDVDLIPKPSAATVVSLSTAGPSLRHSIESVVDSTISVPGVHTPSDSMPCCDADMERHEKTMHDFYTSINDDRLLHPLVHDNRYILDVGCGTGIWAKAVASAYQHSTIFGIDLSSVETSTTEYDLLGFFQVDANDSYWGWDDRFNFVHIRGMEGYIKNWKTSLWAAFRSQAPGGFIEISDITISPTDRSAGLWSKWFSMLELLESAAGLSHGIHADGHAYRQLKEAGYEPVGSNCRSFHLMSERPDDRCLLEGFVGHMAGTFSRALKIAPQSWTMHQQREIEQKLREELLEKGLIITVHKLIAQKPEAGGLASEGADGDRWEGNNGHS